MLQIQLFLKIQVQKKKLLKHMIKESGKEYIFSSDAEKIYIEYFDDFFKKIYEVKRNKEVPFEYTSLERNTSKKIPSSLVSDILTLKTNEIQALEKKSRNFLKDAYKEGIRKEKNNVFYNSPTG